MPFGGEGRGVSPQSRPEPWRGGACPSVDNGDWELYQGFVQGLGVSDVQGQMEHLELYRSLLEPRLEQAREEAKQKSKVFVALGLFAGVTLSLLLL